MKCINDGCENELTGRQKECCSDRCRKAVKRNSDKTGQSNPDKPKSDTKVGQMVYIECPDEKVYCRQAVSYDLAERWDTRPMPLNPDDQPIPRNRGRYTRVDGSVYQFDVGGRVFETIGGKLVMTSNEDYVKSVASLVIGGMM